MKIVLQFVAVAAFVFAADFVWLGIVMKGFYQRELHDLIRQGPEGFAPRLLPAFFVYVLIPAGIILFVGPHAARSTSLLAAARWGALFGFIVYGIYDFTNYSILEKWPVSVTIADLLWGTFLCGGSSLCMKLVGRTFENSATGL